jgi:hypothetical protein
MRVPLLLLSATLLGHAEPLSNSNRESLLEDLEKFQKTAATVENTRFRLAIDAYRTALESDAAAMALYLDCAEKVEFQDKLKDSSEFREWKRAQSDKLASSDLRLALRYQLRWLILTLQADSEHADLPRVIAEAQQCVDSIFSDYEKFVPHAEVLAQAASSSIFAQAYDIEVTQETKWPASPLDLSQLYEDILLPPLRNPEKLQALRATWIKYITQENLKYRFTPPKKHDPKRQRGGAKKDAPDQRDYPPGKSPEAIKFVTETQPKLEWQMEEDLFQFGDEAGAAVRMLTHLQKYVDHPDFKTWCEAYKARLTNQTPPAAPSEPTPAP